MMSVADDVVTPVALVIPNVTEAIRDTLIAPLGTIVYNTTTDKLNFCKAVAAAVASWEIITSVQDS